MATKAIVEYVGPIHGNSTYSDAIAETICERIAGGETLTGICLGEDMPPIRTVSGWLMRNTGGFQAKYALAREAQMHLEAEQIREIADNAYEDYSIDYNEAGQPFVVVNKESVKRAQLRIDARKWRAERLNRRVYGNSTRHELEVRMGPPVTAAELPPGIAWLEGQLLESKPAEGPEPGDSGVGEE